MSKVADLLKNQGVRSVARCVRAATAKGAVTEDLVDALI